MSNKSGQSAITEIGRLIREQDNRATDAPIFIVEEKRRTYGFDPAYSDEVAWIDSENDYEEADAETHARLERLHDDLHDHDPGETVPGKWTRTAYKDNWHFVTACFTEQGCKDYITLNGHNHKELRIYAAGSWRNEEWRTVRKFLMEQS